MNKIPKKLIKANINFYEKAVKSMEKLDPVKSTNEEIKKVVDKIIELKADKNLPEDLPMFRKIDDICTDALDVVNELLERFKETHHGFSSEQLALMNIKAGCVLWLQTRKEYIESYLNKQ